MSNRLDGRTGLAILTVFALVMTLFAVFGSSSAQASDHQIRICHQEGNGGYTAPNPTKFQIWSPDGHGSFDAGVHPGDIIPPFDAGSQGNNSWDAYPGKNWDAEGQAIWNNNCEEPATTTTTQATTTTTEATTTTTEATTTTTEATTTTTQATTTTTILGTTITSPTSTLPFTGIESEQMVGIAIMLLGSGLLLTVAGMGRREET